MRVLLDESLPSELREHISGHEVSTVQEIGWSGLRNGELLARSAGRFDAFITADQNLRYQQNLSKLPVSVVVIAAKSNRMQDLQPLVAELLGALSSLQGHTLVQIGS